MEQLGADVQARGDGEPLRIVPLVFDANGELYTPASYHALVEGIMSLPGGDAAGPDPSGTLHPPVYYTTYDAFQQAIAGGVSPSGRSYSEIYAGAKWVDAAETIDGEEQEIDGYDIYVLDQGDDILQPPPCEGTECPPGGGSGGGIGGGGGTTGGGGSPTRTRLPDQVGTVPVWPEMWAGDVITGYKFGDADGFGPMNLGHSLIITQLQTGTTTGGDYTDPNTLSMEAIGTKRDDGTHYTLAEQVQERNASYWFARPQARRAVIRYSRNSTWAQRARAVSIARAQDPDPYSILTPKTSGDKWYCSKLVWYAYRRAMGDNLDPTSGLWVTPEDLYFSNNLVTVLDYTRTR